MPSIIHRQSNIIPIKIGDLIQVYSKRIRMRGSKYIKRLTIIIILSIICISCIFLSEGEGYVDEANIYLKLAHESNYDGCRIYISRSDKFGSDYIQFNYTQVTAPKIYFVEPDTLYVIDKDSFYITDLKNEQFVIKYINHIYPQIPSKNYKQNMERIAREDSIIKAKPHFSIDIGDNADILTVFNPESKIVLVINLVYWLF